MKAGDRVRHVKNPEYGFGTVKLVEKDPLEDHEIILVTFDWLTGSVSCTSEQLEGVPRIESGVCIPAFQFGSLEELQARLGAGMILSEHSKTAAFCRSFITPLPHQAYLLEKIHAHRHYGHLIADDVGMGKTIEAGLVIAAERLANPGLRVLIIAPKNVLLQWQDEMDEHFGLNFRIAKHDFAIDRAIQFEGINLVIASRDGLKQDSHRDVLKAIQPFDLIVCDEAHALTARREFFSGDLETTANFRFLRWLSENHVVSWEQDSQGAPRSPRFLFLTATPHQGDDFRFLNLLNLVRPDLINPEDEESLQSEPDMEALNACLSRTPKRRAVDWDGNPIFKGHHSRTIDIELTGDEQAVLKMLAWYVYERMTFKTSGQNDALVRSLAMHSYQKIAASSWRALESALNARLEGKTPGEDDLDEALTDFDYLGDEREADALGELLIIIRKINHDSKASEFRRLLQPGFGFRSEGEKVLVFTQYRVTQLMLKELVESLGLKAAIINGSLSIQERKLQRSYFEDEADIMISTEAGSEGANLQRKCHLLINYDSPWNPMRLLQRIGRLDRYGQTHEVRALTLRAPATWDAQISQRIEERLEVVQRTMGLLAEEDYWHMIIGEVYDDLNPAALMAAGGSDVDGPAVQEAIDREIQKIKNDQSRLKQLISDSLGMPKGFEERGSVLGADEFRLAFAWAAATEEVKLQRTKTAENKHLPGVFHFTLPKLFRQALRASRECYIVFDRERFSEVRSELLGRARGQEIRPMLAGLGEAVTDWFFTRAASASTNTIAYSLKSKTDQDTTGRFWIVFMGRWKDGSIGPNFLRILEINAEGEFHREIENKLAFHILANAEEGSSEANFSVPDLSKAKARVQPILKKMVEKVPSLDRANLRFEPWLFIVWE